MRLCSTYGSFFVFILKSTWKFGTNSKIMIFDYERSNECIDFSLISVFNKILLFVNFCVDVSDK